MPEERSVYYASMNKKNSAIYTGEAYYEHQKHNGEDCVMYKIIELGVERYVSLPFPSDRIYQTEEELYALAYSPNEAIAKLKKPIEEEIDSLETRTTLITDQLKKGLSQHVDIS